MSDILGMRKIPYKTKRNLIVGAIILAYTLGWYIGGRFQEYNIAKKKIETVRTEERNKVVDQITNDINLILEKYKQEK